MAVGLRVFTERTGETPHLPLLDVNNGESLMHLLYDVSIVLGNRAAQSPGTLFITSKQVIWLNDLDMSQGYAVNFASISLHAVSRDPLAYPSPCIYSLIETGEDEEDQEDETGAQTTNWSFGISKIKEMRLVPSDPNQLEILFETFCKCAELNPDPMKDEDEDEAEEAHNWIFSADQLKTDVIEDDVDWAKFSNLIGHSDGDHDLAHNVLQLRIDDQRFEDAEEMERDQNIGLQ